MYKIAWFVLFVLLSGCTFPTTAATPAAMPSEAPVAGTPVTGKMPTAAPAATMQPSPTPVQHLVSPAETMPPVSLRGYDTVSDATASEKRAPYGEHYQRNLFERPFDQQMQYYPGLDIRTFTLAEDSTWYYITIEVLGAYDALPTTYGVELDLDLDGFGDILIIAPSSIGSVWQADGVQVYEDTNHDTGGLSASLSDAPFAGNGYDRLRNDDPDLAWARVANAVQPQIQIAFKRSLAGNRFLFGAVADAGWNAPGKYDYNDRMGEPQAGSSIISNTYYPLKDLYLFDNTCRQAYGFTSNGQEARVCPPVTPPTPVAPTCRNPEQYETASACEEAGCTWITYNGEISYSVCSTP